MTKRTAAKYKIDRRMGENIWGRPKSPVNRREYGPGQHGQRRKAKLSDFGLQLRAKQKLKGYYGDLTEKQFRRIYSEAERVKGDTGENLIGLLEKRLDAVIYRAKFVATMFAARQFVNHGHILVNGKRVNIPSFRVKEGDVIEVREKSKQIAVSSKKSITKIFGWNIFSSHRFILTLIEKKFGGAGNISQAPSSIKYEIFVLKSLNIDIHFTLYTKK